MKACVLNLFFLPLWIWSCFCVNREKISFSCPDIADFEILIWGPSVLYLIFINEFTPFVQKTACVRLSKENPFFANNAPEISISNSWRHQELLLVVNHLICKIKIFLFEINSEDIDISKLQLTLSTLVELKDSDTIDTSTIILKNYKDIS